MSNKIYRPEIIIPANEGGMERLHELLHQIPDEFILDNYVDFQKEILKLDNPRRNYSDEDFKEELDSRIDGIGLYSGTWVFYPWKNTLIHLPTEEEFIKIRTSRNLYKITEQERDLLAEKKVGIIGLSVGHSVAMNLALERSLGELRLADFDSMELSNLNRIRTNIFNVGIPKVIVAAREIAELDPFIKVDCFFDGITEENIDEFYLGGGKLDMLVEECDSLHIKILSRKKAKEHGIPVLMETSDRGMLDVERFDLDPDRPILHGMIEHLDQELVKNLKTSEEKIPYLMPMVGLETMSPRLKASALEVGNTIGTWPQLGTSVMLGGAVLADTYRRIMLDQFKESGRFIVDPSEILKESSVVNHSNGKEDRARGVLSKKEMLSAVHDIKANNSTEIDIEVIKKIVLAAGTAPSGGNSQPWKWLCKNSTLFLFFDKTSSDSFMDFHHSASYMALGSALENARVKASSLGYKTNSRLFPEDENNDLIAILSFEKSEVREEELAIQIEKRYTDRRILVKNDIPSSEITQLENICADFKSIESTFIKSEEDINAIAEVISTGDWLRVMNIESHRDFVKEEMRWTRDQLQKERNGIFVEELMLSPNDLAGLYLVKDENVINFMTQNNYGHGLKHISRNIINSAPVLFTAYCNEFTKENFVQAGILMERLWLKCTALKIGVQVVNVPLAFILRLKEDNLGDLSPEFVEEIKLMEKKMRSVNLRSSEMTDLFIMRLFKADLLEPTSIRRELNQILEIE